MRTFREKQTENPPKLVTYACSSSANVYLVTIDLVVFLTLFEAPAGGPFVRVLNELRHRACHQLQR